ncbi:MAG: hypothetical protein P4L46_13975 [Fimbriimonas sp.]|nr:hypothetical protein [Fimbriimonas sp.]
MSRSLITRKARADQAAVESARLSVNRRRIEFDEFIETYEDLVEVLCSAAQLGPSAKLENAYGSVRPKFQAQYPGQRPFLISFLEFVPNDELAGLKLSGRPLDAFEALVAANDLQEFIESDDGTMISRITRTREALSLYSEHLRLLAAQLL